MGKDLPIEKIKMGNTRYAVCEIIQEYVGQDVWSAGS